MGEAAFISSCDIAKSTLAKLGVSYRNVEGEAGAPAQIQIGDNTVQSVSGAGLAPPALAAVRHDFEGRLGSALRSAGYPNRADPAKVNLPLLIAIVLLGVVFAVMVYAPVPAMVVEIFPTRIRYSALSLPYHIGSGWFGGFLPAIVFAMVAATGNIYFGLWYPVVVTAVGIVVLGFFTKETRGQDLNQI